MKCRRNYNNIPVFFGSTGIDELGHALFTGEDPNKKYLNYSIHVLLEHDENDEIIFPDNPRYDVCYVDNSTNDVYMYTKLFDSNGSFNLTTEIETALNSRGYEYVVLLTPKEVIDYLKNIKSRGVNYSSDAQAVCDALIQKLSIIKNELWYDPKFGLPLIDRVRNKGIIDAFAADIISSQYGVYICNSFASNIENKHNYNLSFSVISNYAPDEVKNAVSINV